MNFELTSLNATSRSLFLPQLYQKLSLSPLEILVSWTLVILPAFSVLCLGVIFLFQLFGASMGQLYPQTWECRPLGLGVEWAFLWLIVSLPLIRVITHAVPRILLELPTTLLLFLSMVWSIEKDYHAQVLVGCFFFQLSLRWSMNALVLASQTLWFYLFQFFFHPLSPQCCPE